MSNASNERQKGRGVEEEEGEVVVEPKEHNDTILISEQQSGNDLGNANPITANTDIVQSPKLVKKKKIVDHESEKLVTKSILALINSPSLFAKVILQFVPRDYQRRFLNEQAKRIVVCAGRQVGKSTMAASRAIHFAICHPKTTTLIVSATLRQSMNLFEKVLDFSGRDPFLCISTTKRTRREIQYSNGSKIIALPCGPVGNSLRGYTADLVIIDEAAFVPDEVISNVVFPMLATTSGTLILLSTPWDRAHTFYKAFNSSEGWAKFHFPSSASPTVTKEFLEEQRTLFGEQRFAQEYLAEFMDDEQSYFPMSLLRKCVHVCPSRGECQYCKLVSSPIQLASISGGIFYGGYDPGGKSDPAAFVVVEKEKSGPPNKKNTLRVLLCKSFHATGKDDSNTYTRTTMEIANYHSKLKLSRILVDETGLGQPIVERCKELGMPVEGLILSSKTKEELLSNLRLVFEKENIVLPHDNHDLLSNLSCIEYDLRAGGYTFSHPSGSHDDLAFALALAVWGATKGSVTILRINDDDADCKESKNSWRRLGQSL